MTGRLGLLASPDPRVFLAAGRLRRSRQLQRVATLGCINTAPRDDVDKPCLYDLVLRGDRCVRSPAAPKIRRRTGAPKARCASRSATPASTSARLLRLYPAAATSPEDIYCEAIDTDNDPATNPMLAFEEVCNRRCRLRCQRLQWFCPGYVCPAGTCEQPDVQAKCLADCPLAPNGGKDLACLSRSCTDARRAVCDSSLTCPNGVMPACATITCTNNCMFEGNGLSGDGYCDDGDVYASDSPLCSWGSDCIDSRAAPGYAPQPGLLGSVCQIRSTARKGGSSDRRRELVRRAVLHPGVPALHARLLARPGLSGWLFVLSGPAAQRHDQHRRADC